MSWLFNVISKWIGRKLLFLHYDKWKLGTWKPKINTVRCMDFHWQSPPRWNWKWWPWHMTRLWRFWLILVVDLFTLLNLFIPTLTSINTPDQERHDHWSLKSRMNVFLTLYVAAQSIQKSQNISFAMVDWLIDWLIIYCIICSYHIFLQYLWAL